MAVTVGGTSITFNDGTTQSTAAGGAPTTAQVLAAYAGATYGAVGSFCSAYNASASDILVGGTIAGSSLRKQNVTTTIVSAGLAGTWRCMGPNESNNSNSSPNPIWLRIS